jgi:hypothetical protein
MFFTIFWRQSFFSNEPGARPAAVPQDFTVTLTDEQAEALRQIADHWRESLEEALRRVVKEGIDIEMMEKANDEQHANSTSRQYGPSGDLDDDIPF